MKRLIVEDEIKTGEYLKQGLSEAGFVVDLSYNAIRHTPVGDQVTIKLSHADSKVLSLIQNPGTPIPAAQLSKVFELRVNAWVSCDLKSYPMLSIGGIFVITMRREPS